MSKDDPSKLVFMAIEPLIASILTDIDAGFKKLSHPDGSIIVELDQALNGCIETALWYKHLQQMTSYDIDLFMVCKFGIYEVYL